MRRKDGGSSLVVTIVWGKAVVALAKVGRCSCTVMRLGRLSSLLEVEE